MAGDGLEPGTDPGHNNWSIVFEKLDALVAQNKEIVTQNLEILARLSSQESKLNSALEDITYLTLASKDHSTELARQDIPISKLEEQVGEFSVKLEKQEAHSRKYNLEIHGIKQTQDECIPGMVLKLCSPLGLQVQNYELMAAHRYDKFRKER